MDDDQRSGNRSNAVEGVETDKHDPRSDHARHDETAQASGDAGEDMGKGARGVGERMGEMTDHVLGDTTRGSVHSEDEKMRREAQQLAAEAES